MPTRSILAGDDSANTLNGNSGADLIYGFDPNGPQHQTASLSAARVASGFDQPLFATAAPDDFSRLFVVEKTGAIRIYSRISPNSAGANA